ncbi:hypothetical protein B566_EDAN004192 [Ephemera danica]|nr:hypothetical protein B566_EDAN004192 [Ephemera danica]
MLNHHAMISIKLIVQQCMSRHAWCVPAVVETLVRPATTDIRRPLRRGHQKYKSVCRPSPLQNMAAINLLLCVVAVVTLFLPLQNNAQFNGFPDFQQQPFAQGGRQNQAFGRGPQRQVGGNRQQQQVPWVETGNRRPSGGQGQVPWTETSQQGGRPQGQVPWTETSQQGGRPQQGQVPWTEVSQGNRPQTGQGQVPWTEISQGSQGGGAGTTTTTTQAPTRPCSCTSTAEYNPVCGSDNATYSNPGRLQCAIQCRQPIELIHYGVCRVEPDRG